MFRGERVMLRAFVREDMERQCLFENDPELWFWDGGTPKSVSLERLLAGHDASLNEADNDSGSFAIEVEDLYIGHCSLHNFDETSRHCELSVEIGDRVFMGVLKADLNA